MTTKSLTSKADEKCERFHEFFMRMRHYVNTSGSFPPDYTGDEHVGPWEVFLYRCRAGEVPPIDGQSLASSRLSVLKRWRRLEILQRPAMEEDQNKTATPEHSPVHSSAPSPAVSPLPVSPLPNPVPDRILLPSTNNVEVAFIEIHSSLTYYFFTF